MAKSRSRRNSKAPPVELPRDVVIHIGAAQEGQTVGQLLKGQLKSISWNQARGLCTSQRIMINGNLCADPARRLKAGEVLKVLAQPLAKPPSAEDIEIYYLDQHLVVFEKPAGITSIRHADERRWSKRRRQRQATLDELLPAAIEKHAGRGPSKRREPPPRIRVVHRLDRDTSGVMVAARTVPAEQALIAQFKQHTTERAYVAICQGHVAPQTIRNHLVRDRGDGLRGSTADTAVGKLAVTHVRPLEHGPGFSVVECRLETGRTHQIRIHLAELGHPLYGEKMYLKRMGHANYRDTSGAPRHALHAAVLGLVHPTTGQTMRFESPLPRDMQNLLRKLRK